MITSNQHPSDLGNIPFEVLYRCFGDLLPVGTDSIHRHWKELYPFISRKKDGLYINVKKADLWLDQRGEKLFSELLLVRKRERNPDWLPIEVSKVGATTLTATSKSATFDCELQIEKMGGAK